MVRLSGQIKGWSEFQSNYGWHLSALSCQISFSQNSVHFLTKRGISPTSVMQKLPQLKNSGSKLLSPWFWSNEKFERNFSDKMGNIEDIWSRWKSIFIKFIAGNYTLEIINFILHFLLSDKTFYKTYVSDSKTHVWLNFIVCEKNTHSN